MKHSQGMEGKKLKCQECQANPATLHFAKIINGKKTEMHLCEQCAKSKGDIFQGQNSFSIHNLLSGFLNFDTPIKSTGASNFAFSSLKCDKCGMSYEQFAEMGRFGCANCYQVFDSKLDPLLRRVHSGNISHQGKIPKRGGSDIHHRKNLLELKAKLAEHVKREEFEKAAQIRDEIRSLEMNYRKEQRG